MRPGLELVRLVHAADGLRAGSKKSKPRLQGLKPGNLVMAYRGLETPPFRSAVGLFPTN
jgi:hypothetical protein